VNAIKGMITSSMVVDYIRVRKSNIKELQEMIEQRKSDKLFMLTLLIVPAVVVAVAVIGLIATL